jgi:hypothetical protein
MKKLLIFLIFLAPLFILTAQEEIENPFKLKAGFIYGKIFKHTKHLQEIVQGPTRGFELDYEMLTFNEKKDWHHYFKQPVIGIGGVYLNLGNDAILGDLIAVYPYLNFSLIKIKPVSLNLKAGAGASYLTKTFQDTKYIDSSTGQIILGKSNAAIGSHLNVYFALGGNLDIQLFRGISLNGELNWNHASNGSFYTPNSGLNMLNAMVGITYSPDYQQKNHNSEREIPDLKKKTSLEIMLSGGAKQLDYRDNIMFPTGSFAFAINRIITNQFRLGVGIDAFYNGAYASVNSAANPVENISKAKFTYLTEDKLLNRFRGGISLQPELIFGKMICGFHFGLYLFNPVRNLEPYADASTGTLNKALIYPYDIEKENGWLYTRASFKYLINNNLFINIGLKTHLHKAEFIEWGLGYRL